MTLRKRDLSEETRRAIFDTCATHSVWGVRLERYPGDGDRWIVRGRRGARDQHEEVRVIITAAPEFSPTIIAQGLDRRLAQIGERG